MRKVSSDREWAGSPVTSAHPHLFNTVGYDTPERVADVFGHSNAIPLPGVGGGIRQGAMGGLATLQQALGARGIQLQTTDEEESGQEANGRNQDSGLSRQEVSQARYEW